MFPSSPSHASGGTNHKRHGVGFSSASHDPLGLLSVPRLPPDPHHGDPAFHVGVDPNAPSPRRYPTASELHDKAMRLNPVLFASARWFSVIGVCSYNDIAHSFADGAGMLPGQIPLQAIRFLRLVSPHRHSSLHSVSYPSSGSYCAVIPFHDRRL